MNTNHTPGPWKVYECTDGTTNICGNRDYPDGVCKMLWSGKKQRDEANARLIATAPEMLAAVIEAHNVLEAAALCLTPRGSRSRLDSAIEQARAAIAKATGGAA